MQVEKNVVISEFIVNMEDVLYHRDNTDVNIAEKVAEQTASLAHYGVAHYVLTNATNQQDSDNLHIVQTDLFEHYPKLTLYFYRILMAFDFLHCRHVRIMLPFMIFNSISSLPHAQEILCDSCKACRRSIIA